MKVRRIKVGIKSVESILDDFVKTGEAIERGQKVKKETGTYFTSLEAFRKAVTPKRMELLHIIKKERPSSINELARMAKRDVKNVADDVKYLAQIGLIEKKETKSRTAPVATYEKLMLEISV
jgi:predicted transcriptional regulator